MTTNPVLPYFCSTGYKLSSSSSKRKTNKWRFWVFSLKNWFKSWNPVRLSSVGYSVNKSQIVSEFHDEFSSGEQLCPQSRDTARKTHQHFINNTINTTADKQTIIICVETGGWWCSGCTGTEMWEFFYPLINTRRSSTQLMFVFLNKQWDVSSVSLWRLCWPLWDSNSAQIRVLNTFL